ncbi:MAG: PEP/pyruvate-binding domain-containing protein [Candidatus Nanosyncoccaceae bacterium]
MGRILLLDDSTDAGLVGQLGAHLSKLKREGLNVADGFILPIGFELIDGMTNEIIRGFDRINASRNRGRSIKEETTVILRPSYMDENHDSEVLRDVARRELIDAVKYLQKNSMRRGRRLAIVIQNDLFAETSGTVHSINPATKDANEVLVEANLWMNDTVLGGESEPDMILIDKNTGATSLESEEEVEICLEPEQIHELYTLVRRMEKRLGYPISLDWAYDRGVLYILRARKLDKARLENYRYED